MDTFVSFLGVASIGAKAAETVVTLFSESALFLSDDSFANVSVRS